MIYPALTGKVRKQGVMPVLPAQIEITRESKPEWPKRCVAERQSEKWLRFYNY